jgi:hypothetical protein
MVGTNHPSKETKPVSTSYYAGNHRVSSNMHKFGTERTRRDRFAGGGESVPDYKKLTLIHEKKLWKNFEEI